MDLSQIVNDHMDEHAPSAIGGGFGVGAGQALAGAAPQTMADVPTTGAIPTGMPPGAPGASPLMAAGKMLGAAGSSLAPSMVAHIAPPAAAAPAPSAGAAPPMLQALPQPASFGQPLGAPPAMATSDRRAKARILPGADDIDEMLQAVHEVLSKRSRR